MTVSRVVNAEKNVHPTTRELVLSVVSDRDPSEFPVIASAVESRLKDRLGVRIAVDVVVPGALDAWTEVDVSPKLKRFRDER